MPATILCMALAGCALRPVAEAPPVLPRPLPGILLLGEIHDHPDGHARRLALLQRLLADGWRPAIALEQFDREQQAALTAAQASCGLDVDCLIRHVGAEGWDWRHYRPVLTLAQQHGLRLLAANLSRADARALVRGGVAALAETDVALRASLATVPAELLRAQQRLIAAAHCQQLPADLLPGMALAQVARDQVMAAVITRAGAEGVVLLAGNGHVRRDLGVPRWLSVPSYAVGFLDVDAPGDAGAYDQVVRLRPATRDDPCRGR